jgi:TorA maturation chaperone TorD
MSEGVADPGRAGEEEVARALHRAAVYRLLGGAFAHPTRARVTELGALASALAGHAADPALRQSLAELAEAARTADAGGLAEVHAGLFDRVPACPAYEGVYGVPQLAGKAAQLADIAAFYAAFAVTPAAREAELPDHVATELEFMSVLALKEAYALAEGDRDGLEVTRAAARAFLRDHLGRWAETFADDVARATPVRYYRAAATVLAGWIRAEMAVLAVVTARVDPRPDRAPDDDQAFTCPMASP